MLIPFFHRILRRHLLRQGVQSKLLELEGTLLHYYEMNPPRPSPTVVLIHGLGTSASTWTHLLPSLGRRFRALAPDLPGFGFSSRKNEFLFLRLEEYVRTLKAFLDSTVPGPFTLVGHSLGGWIAMRYAAQEPQRVQHLILMNTAGIYYEGTERQRELFQLESVKDTDRLLNHLWLRYPWYFRPFSPFIFQDLVRRKVPDIVRLITQDDFMNSSLRRLIMPVSILWGMDDRLISPESLAIMQREIPKVSITRIDRCGHVPQLERPKELLENLLQTLAKHRIDEKT